MEKENLIADEMKLPEIPLRKLGTFVKVIQVKAKPGDFIFMPWIWAGNSGISKLEVLGISITKCELAYHTYLGDIPNRFQDKYNRGVFHDVDFGEKVFTAYEAAKIHLNKLKGIENA